MENFISGYPGCEFQIRETLADTIGKDKSELFFDKVRSGMYLDLLMCDAYV